MEEASVEYIVQSIYDYLKSKTIFMPEDIAYCFYLITHKFKMNIKQFDLYTNSILVSDWLKEVLIYNEFCESLDRSKYSVYRIEDKFFIKVLKVDYCYTIVS